MKVNPKSSHDQNAVNLGLLNTAIETMGVAYNPSRDDLKLENLKTVQVEGQNVLDEVKALEIVAGTFSAAKNTAFDGFDENITRSINAVRISKAPEQTIIQGEALVRELRGLRVSKKLTEDEIAEAKAKGEDISQIDKHNSSFESKILFYGKYILFLESVPQYKPNETDLTIQSQKTRLQQCKTANSDSVVATVKLTAARMKRTNFFYSDDTGLVDLALSAKLYVKSAFGARSPQYKMISNITFSKPR